MKTKEEKRVRRKKRVRKKIRGTNQRPRLSVHRSLKNLYAQIIDDERGHTLCWCSTLDKEFKKVHNGEGGNIKAAFVLGETLAKKVLNLGIKKVVFDRDGYIYHGRIKAFADGCRKGGLEF